MPEVAESLAVDLEGLEGKPLMFLFVVPSQGTEFDDALAAKIKRTIAADLSRRHVPDFVVRVGGVPRTLNGKKLEIPVRRILAGGDVDAALNRDSLANPGSVDEFAELAKRFRRDGKL